ncbi:MAG: hypothetical protein H7A48_14385 [Akkermansiaceae bacterium]|nr:hypothetical protein [Akkermansiaceae bacterium]MCP5548319.1 hypothetical protein [Akkermansiaceae bacterium]
MTRPLLFLLLASPAMAIPASTTLTLVNEPGFNVLDITVSGPNITTSTTQSTLTGTVTATLDVDNDLGQTSELTLSDGVVAGSDFTASGTASVSFFTGPYQLNATNLAGTFFTFSPPGTVTPATGEFAASQHRFVINQGDVEGTALGQTTFTTFSEENPFEGAGSGTGTVTLTPAGTTASGFLYQIVVVVPGVNVSDSITVGSTFTTTVTVSGTGTIKAEGTIEVPRSAFTAWALAEGVPGASIDGDANHDGVPNGIAWAMGLGAMDSALAAVPRVAGLPSPGFEIPCPPGGTRAPITIQVSDSLGNWTNVPAARCSAGVNPLPAGTAGTVWVSASGTPREFLRLRVTE